MSGYPKELYHPNGIRTVVVYDADEERRIRNEHNEYRAEHLRANAAAVRGETIGQGVEEGGDAPNARRARRSQQGAEPPAPVSTEGEM